MSLLKITRLRPVKLLSSINPLTVPRRAVTPGEYRRPGQPKEYKFPWQMIKFDFSKGLEGIKKHFTLLKKEFSDNLVGPEGKPLIEHMLEQNRVIWEFRGAESLDQWTVSSDHEIGGQSEVYLKLGKNNNTCFLYGNLCSTPPKDGETRYSGYCNMRSNQPLVSVLLGFLFLVIYFLSGWDVNSIYQLYDATLTCRLKVFLFYWSQIIINMMWDFFF